MDFGIDSCDGKIACVSADDRATITKLKKLVAAHPGDVIVDALPEDNDGMMVVRVPFKWVKIRPPRHVSESQREAARERAKNLFSKPIN